jgi:2-polyprenyl-3-methyl-5-hydroxy-6-metoxy-1,4-benzoquinol methylase
MGDDQNEKIIESWKENASVWTSAIRNKALESRNLVTNEAIVDAVMACEGNHILDVGCGEGWLTRALSSKGKNVTGFDGSSALITQARKGSAEKFHILSYEDFVVDPHIVGTDFDVVVCNFSLLGDRLDEILKAMLTITKSSRHLIIQTLHPYSSVGELRYENGWREESFNGLAGQWSPMPWYFRTMTSWIRELTSAGWRLEELKEPLHPVTGKPASLILCGMK